MKRSDFSGKDGQIFVLIFCCFCVSLIILLSLLSFLNKYLIYSRTHDVSKWLIGFVALGCIFYILRSIFNAFYWLLFIGIFKNKILETSCDILEFLFLHLGQLMVYCYLLYRIYKGFEGTIYSITWKQYMILCMLLSFYLIACLAILGHLIWFIIWCYINTKTDWDEFVDKTIHFGIVYRIITLVIDFVVSIYLLKLFINKLRKISKNLDRFMDTEILSDDLSNKIDYQNMLIYKDNIYTVTSKVAILGAILLLSSQIVLTFCCKWSYH